MYFDKENNENFLYNERFLISQAFSFCCIWDESFVAFLKGESS